MAITYLSHGGTSNASASSISWNHTVSGASPFLFISVINLTSDTTSGVTVGGQAASLVQKRVIQSNRVLSLYLYHNPGQGSQNIVVSASETVNLRGRSVLYSGVKTTGQPDASSSNHSASTTSLTGTVTTVADNCWLFMCGWSNSSGVGAGASTTMRFDDGAFAVFDSNGAKTPPGNYSLTITGTSGAIGYVIASFSPTSGAGALFFAQY